MTAPSTDGAPTPVAIASRAEAEHPLSRTQQLVWASQRIAPDTPLANMGKIVRLAASIDAARFVDAFDAVVLASDAMRTVIVDRPGRAPVARVLERPPAATEVLDLPLDQLTEWCDSRIAMPIDATVAAYDSVLLRHADDDWTWWFDLHHVVTDAGSSALLFDRVADAYRRGAADELPSFYDHVAAVTAPTDDERRRERAAFWAEQVVDAPPIAPYGPRGERTTAVDRVPVTLGDPPLDRVLHDALDGPYRTISRELGLLALLSAATATLLSRLDGRSAVTIGVPIHHRSGPAARQVVGPLMELSPLRLDVDLDATAAELFERTHRAIVGVLRNARPGESPTARFDAVVNVLTAQYGDFAGVPARTTWARSGHVDPAHPVRVHADRYGERLAIEVDLNRGLSEDGSHLRFPRHLGRLLAAMIADPTARVGAIDVLTDDESQALADLNPAAPGAELRPVHEQVVAALDADPGLITVTSETGDLTASELESRSAAVATWLVASGITQGATVGLRMRRSADVLVAIHGVLRAGAAFVLLDPDDPPARQQTIAADARLQRTIGELPADLPAPDRSALPDVDLDDLAYVLFTSGSTGAPKGVPISHRGLADYLRFAVDAYATDRPPVMALHSSLAFDLTITSLFLPQLLGGRTVVIEGDPVTALSAIARRTDITVLKATPSQLEILSRLADRELPLEVVIVGGEAFRRPVAEAVASICAADVRIYNEYGPTEAVVGCMIHRWDPDTDTGADVPIGHACPGAEVHVIDRGGGRSPIGSWGELWVARPGMAAGYLRRPELDAERFGPVAAIGPQRLYRTGDRVRVTDRGLVFGGRTDDQLSVGGVRVEPGEIEAALVDHPAVTDAVVRLWTPGDTRARRCVRCGLGTDVPDVALDGDDVCTVCRSFELVEPQTRSWFGTPAELDAIRDDARRRSTGDFDALHLLSGGKDSTYALYQLVEQGWRIHALTLDNGYISEGAKANIARTVADLGVSHEFVTTDAMAAIFRDSLDRYANVCNGCYKTIYTLATARAHELGIPAIVTGLSRGQFFETRLVPHQFESGRFDPAAIDATVLDARRAYHRTRDAVTELLPEQAVFERPDLDVLDEITYVDFYRYTDVELADMYRFLDERAPWVRPDDTGRSTNCLINVAGIHVHRTERGFHNYAQPYSWDVRLGHKTRDEALAELDDEIDVDEVDRMLGEVGYSPRRVEILTAWYRTTDGAGVDAAELRAHLADRLPERAIPTAFVHVADIPLAGSAKLDIAGLPAPSRRHTGSVDYVIPATPTEATIAEVWAEVLGVDRVGRHDDFFDLGGSSLPALELIADVEQRLGVDLPDALVFRHRTLDAFAAAVEAARRSGTTTHDIPPLADGEAPLAPCEAAMLFEYRSAPGDPRYNVVRVYTLDGPVDLDRWRAALATVVDRHQPLHRAADAARTRLPIDRAIDLVELGEVGDAELDAAADEMVRRPFDLDRGPLVRVAIGRRSDGRHVVVIGLHHLSVSAGTFDVLWRELDDAAHDRPLPELSTTVAAHGEWQRRRLDDSRRFWETELLARDGRPGTAEIPRPATPEPAGYLVRPTGVAVADLAAATSTTPFAAALAAIAAALSGYARSNVVEIGVTASTKDHPATEPLVGCFLNTMPLRLDVDRGLRLRSLERVAGEVVAGALPPPAQPLSEIVRLARRLGVDVDAPRIRHNVAYERVDDVTWGGRPAAHRTVPTGSAVNDATFFVREGRETIDLALEYDGAAISSETAALLLDSAANAIALIAARPTATVDDAVAGLVGGDLVGPPLPPSDDTVFERFRAHAAAHPADAAVVTAADGTVTYADLAERVDRLALSLARVAPTARRVGVSIGRGPDVVAALLAAWARGAAYVPLDPSVPGERIERIVGQAVLDAVFADAATAHRFDGIPTVDVSPAGGESGGEVEVRDAATELARGPAPDDEAYVVFTSGSTGVPAGVSVSHRALAASTFARDQVYDTAPRRFLMTSSIGFDSSMVGLFWPLAVGGAVVMPSNDEVRDVDRLGDLVADAGVTHLLMVPTLYDALLRRRSSTLRGVRTAIVAGEACPPALVARHHALLPDVELVNEYGPTEATVWATSHPCGRGDDPVPIGRPIPGVTVRVADRDLRPVADGAPGELLIAGPGVVAGYLGGRSNEAFVEVDGRRWYRTGDVVRSVDGVVEFVGRVDEQLNVGGARVEPGEIEAVIGDVDGVHEAVVVASEVGGRSRLVAHVGAEPTVDTAAVRSIVAARLAATAVPEFVVVHDRLPRTPHGKLDRVAAAALPVGVGSYRTDGSVGDLASLWSRVLGQPDLGADADFFALGGNSIAAVELVSALGDLVGQEVPVATLLTAPTPAAMAAALGVAAAQHDGPVALVTLRSGEPDGPLVVMTSAWDDVQGYRSLADAFDARITVVAVAVTDPAADRLEPVTHAAEALIAGLCRSRQRVLVVGWSIGGVVAFDLGQRLGRAGIDVDAIVLIDTYFPGEHRHLWANRWSKYRSMLRPGGFGAAAGELRTMLGRRVKQRVARLARRALVWAGEPPPAAAVGSAVSPGGIPFAALDDRPITGPVPVVLFHADTTNPRRNVVPWRGLAPDLEVVEIVGRHRGFDSIMAADRVPQIVSDLERRLRS